MSISKKMLMMLVGLLAAAPVFAASIDPLGKSAWDMTVYGNGRVVYDVMTGIKLIMASSSFNILLIFLAVLGFVVLAVGAGFDPGKNLLKMFFYIFVVAGVSYGSRGLTVNIMINDKVNQNIVMDYEPVVQNVPALVGLPAVITSAVGEFFTRQFETSFLKTGTFSLTGGSVGQFALFNRMAEDSLKFTFTNTALKKSFSSYISDCTIPAIATGKLTTKELMGTNNYIKTLSKAQHNAIMTKVYADDATILSTIKSAMSASAQSDMSGYTNALPGNGVVVTCTDAYAGLKAAAEVHADELVNGSAAAWSKTGIQVPYGVAMQEMLTNSTVNTVTRPASFIMQQAFINSTTPALRAAAAQTGNNELMQAAAISQAEQNQKSSWVTGFQVFNNMMGYVFTVLQVFIFAITPMIVVALMIPGFGTAIFKNYAQILLWLTLWEPMLAVVNYIITSFSMSAVSSNLTFDSVAAANGAVGVSVESLFSRPSSAVVEEKLNNLTIAAQFLGTMVPMITWGIVKGAMAFTEFISHGIGSSFATQAGSVAASGNMSMGGLSMNNVSNEKFNTAMSSSVGSQDVNAFANAGSGLMTHSMGGGNVTKSGSAFNVQQQLTNQMQDMISTSKQVSDALSQASSKTKSWEEAKSWVQDHTTGDVRSQALAHMKAVENSYSISDSTSKSSSLSQNASDAKNLSDSVANRKSTDLKAGVDGKLGVSSPLGGASAGASYSTGTTHAADSGASNNLGATNASGQSIGATSGESAGHSEKEGDTFTSSHAKNDSNSFSQQHSQRQSTSFQQAMSHAVSSSQSYTQQLSASLSYAQSMSVSSDMDMHSATNALNNLQSTASSMTSYSQLNSAMNNFNSSIGASNLNAGAIKNDIGTGGQGLHANGSPLGAGNLTGDLGAKMGDVKGTVVGQHNQVTGNLQTVGARVDKGSRNANGSMIQNPFGGGNS